ncbi:unnamed protein product [marine sediment metagenome]|uniref:Uncharacterized protein n=1 Tax=marine sediment metagenome TaxID=412755 RepID=X1GW16_9ZZZZ
MRKLALVVAVVLLGTVCYGASYNLDKGNFENAQVYRGQYDTGEVDEDGNPIYATGWMFSINYTELNNEGERRGGTKIFVLTPEKRAKVKNFVTPYLEIIEAEQGITFTNIEEVE